MELNKSIILKITTMNSIYWTHKLFFLELNGTRALMQKGVSLLIPLFLETPCMYWQIKLEDLKIHSVNVISILKPLENTSNLKWKDVYKSVLQCSFHNCQAQSQLQVKLSFKTELAIISVNPATQHKLNQAKPSHEENVCFS